MRTSSCQRTSVTEGRRLVSRDSSWLPRSRCRNLATVITVAAAVAVGAGCGGDGSGTGDPVPTIQTRYEPVASSICAALEVDRIVDDIGAVAGAHSSFRSVAESTYSSRVTCRIVFPGADDRYDHHYWEFDPSGHAYISVYHDLDLLENEHRGLLLTEHRLVENRPGTTLEEIDGWWEAGVLRTTSVVEADSYDPSMEITRITCVATIRHHNLLLQTVFDALAPVGEDAAVAPLLDELTARLVEEVGSHLTLETGTVPPEDGG